MTLRCAKCFGPGPLTERVLLGETVAYLICDKCWRKHVEIEPPDPPPGFKILSACTFHVPGTDDHAFSAIWQTPVGQKAVAMQISPSHAEFKDPNFWKHYYKAFIMGLRGKYDDDGDTGRPSEVKGL